MAVYPRIRPRRGDGPPLPKRPAAAWPPGTLTPGSTC